MKMKKLYSAALMVLSLTGFAQTPFDKYEGQDNVTSVVVNKKMFELMGKVKMETKEDQAYLNLIKKLDNLKVFRTSSVKTASDMRANVESYSSKLEELMRVNENGKNSKIYVKSIAGSSNVNELLLFIESKETILMSLTGDFSLQEIALLTKKMNLPGGDELKKASEK